MAFLPFICYFIFTSRNYGKALKAILGVESNALILLTAFISIAAIGILGALSALKLLKFNRPDVSVSDRARALFLAKTFLITQIIFLVIVINSSFKSLDVLDAIFLLWV